jgi:glyoxylase-like metal-dependent hydrolase (beta-lactamase superfamily II)
MFVPHPFATLFVLLYGPRGAAASGSYALSEHPGNAAEIHCGCETRVLLPMPESYMIFPLRIYLAALAMFLPLLAIAAPQAPPPVRLYTLDCGTLEFKDLRLFSDTGEYDGQTATIAVPCFLIRHPKGTLVWDTGLDPKFVQRSDNGARGIRATLDVSVEKQLQQLNLKPTDITYLAFSHMHLDHTGNANLFTASTWILNRTEMQWAAQPTGGGPVAQETFSGYQHAKTQLIDGDYDVFGDGTVRILKAPGHTPGHQVLLLSLPKSGKVLLSGDLYHFRRDREQKLVPLFNTDRAETLASFDRIERLVANTKARLVIQHDPQDFKALPKFPAYLE